MEEHRRIEEGEESGETALFSMKNGSKENSCLAVQLVHCSAQMLGQTLVLKMIDSINICYLQPL